MNRTDRPWWIAQCLKLELWNRFTRIRVAILLSSWTPGAPRPQTPDAPYSMTQIGLVKSRTPINRCLTTITEYSILPMARQEAPNHLHRCTVCTTAQSQLRPNDTMAPRFRYLFPVATSPPLQQIRPQESRELLRQGRISNRLVAIICQIYLLAVHCNNKTKFSVKRSRPRVTYRLLKQVAQTDCHNFDSIDGFHFKEGLV